MSTKVICIANQKGGDGGTTTALALAHGLAQNGRRVLLIDLDPQGQSATALGRNPEPGAFYLLTMGSMPQETAIVQAWVRFSGRQGLYLLPGDRQTMAAQTALNAQDEPISAVRQSLQRFLGQDLDYIILDTEPGIGGTFLGERAVWASDLVIVPTATEFLSADGVPQVLLMMSILQERKNWRGNLCGILPTFLDEQTRESRAAMENLQERFGASLLPPIHRSALLRECAAAGRTIFEFDPMCRAAREYLALTRHVLKFQEADNDR